MKNRIHYRHYHHSALAVSLIVAVVVALNSRSSRANVTTDPCFDLTNQDQVCLDRRAACNDPWNMEPFCMDLRGMYCQTSTTYSFCAVDPCLDPTNMDPECVELRFWMSCKDGTNTSPECLELLKVEECKENPASSDPFCIDFWQHEACQDVSNTEPICFLMREYDYCKLSNFATPFCQVLQAREYCKDSTSTTDLKCVQMRQWADCHSDGSHPYCEAIFKWENCVRNGKPLATCDDIYKTTLNPPVEPVSDDNTVVKDPEPTDTTTEDKDIPDYLKDETYIAPTADEQPANTIDPVLAEEYEKYEAAGGWEQYIAANDLYDSAGDDQITPPEELTEEEKTALKKKKDEAKKKKDVSNQEDELGYLIDDEPLAVYHFDPDANYKSGNEPPQEFLDFAQRYYEYVHQIELMEQEKAQVMTIGENKIDHIPEEELALLKEMKVNNKLTFSQIEFSKMNVISGDGEVPLSDELGQPVKKTAGLMVLQGQGPANKNINIHIYSDPLVVTTKTDENGDWQYTVDSSLPEGSHEAYIAILGDDGSEIRRSDFFEFMVSEAVAAVVDDTPEDQPGISKKSNDQTLLLFGIIAGAFILIVPMNTYIVLKFVAKRDRKRAAQEVAYVPARDKNASDILYPENVNTVQDEVNGSESQDQ